MFTTTLMVVTSYLQTAKQNYKSSPSTWQKVSKFFENLFNEPTYGELLDTYILSRNPKTTHDVEILEREFDKNRKKMLMHFKAY